MGKEYKVLDEWLNPLESAVNRLLEFKERGELVKYEFNGHWLYSDTVTMDSAYLEIVGCTKDELDAKNKEYLEKLEAESKAAEKKALLNVPGWISKGYAMLPEAKWKDWMEIVPIRAMDLYHGMELDATLEIQDILATNNPDAFDKAKEKMNEAGHSGTSWALTCAMIKEFCTNGEEFVKFVNEKEISNEEIDTDNIDIAD